MREPGIVRLLSTEMRLCWVCFGCAWLSWDWVGWAWLFLCTGLGSVELYTSPLELARLYRVGLGWAGRSEVRLIRAGLGVA